MRLLETEKKLMPLRDPNVVMSLNRLGSFHQCRISFMRQLLRRIKDERWGFSCELWEISKKGYGKAVYRFETPNRSYSLIAFSRYLPDNKRSDRVIADAWDLTFCLFDGIPDGKDIKRLEKNVPLQESGRVSEKELVLGRANRSVRLWKYVVKELSSGRQPSVEKLDSVGYLMRTTAVYGSGKFGALDYSNINSRQGMASPFQAELLSVYMIRQMTVDLVNHIAKHQGRGKAVGLDESLSRSLGIGNSTGLGMAPFLVNHPDLLNKWILARETAIARVRSVFYATSATKNDFLKVIERCGFDIQVWTSDDPEQKRNISTLNEDYKKFSNWLNNKILDQECPWDKLIVWVEKNLSIDCQELILSLILEPHSYLVDDLGLEMSFQSSLDEIKIDGSLNCQSLARKIALNYQWALSVDYSKKEEHSKFWYISEEKLEPRLGERFSEEGAELEQPLAIGKDIKAFYEALIRMSVRSSLAEFLLSNSNHRHTARRVGEGNYNEYREIQDNLISERMRPIDLLRCKLSFFGATRFDPRSDRWLRICMYRNASLPSEINQRYDDYWIYSDTTNLN